MGLAAVADDLVGWMAIPEGIRDEAIDKEAVIARNDMAADRRSRHSF